MSSEGFLSRWSRRKQEVREAEQTEPAAQEPVEGAEPDRAPDAAASAGGQPEPSPDETELSPDEIARLPSLDELTADTDLSLFLRKGVPEALRNAALRRMWSLDPKIRDFVCEAREYAYDWNVPGGVPGSGVLPPSEEVAKMAARIVGGGPAPAPEQAVQAHSKDREHASPAEPPVPPLPGEAAPPLLHHPPGAPLEISAAPMAPAGPSPSDRAEAGSGTQRDLVREPADPPVPVRRHGGAMPL